MASMRNGISPVLGVILLIVLALGAVGGFGAWYLQTQEGLIDRFTDDASIAAINVDCEGNVANVTLDNTGDTDVDAGVVNAYLYRDQDLVASTTEDLSGKAFTDAGGRDFAAINFSSYMKGDTFYDLDIEFIDAGYTVETNCVAQPFAVGEVSAVFTEDGTWEQVSFRRRYVDPVVVATTNTKYTGQDPLIPQVKNVTENGAWMRLCDHDDADGCGAHDDEIMGYVAVDAAALNIVNESEAGTATIPSSGGESGTSVTFDETFQGDPVVFVTANTNNNETSTGWGEFSTWVTGNATSTGFSLTRCNHDESSVNNCEGHGNSEEIGWFAVNPDRMAVLDTAAGMTTALPDDQWERVDLTGFDGTPVALAMIQGNDGGQDPKVSEAQAHNSTVIEVHFCEHDAGETCNSHADNFVGWMAAEQGPLVANNSFIP